MQKVTKIKIVTRTRRSKTGVKSRNSEIYIFRSWNLMKQMKLINNHYKGSFLFHRGTNNAENVKELELVNVGTKYSTITWKMQIQRNNETYKEKGGSKFSY